MLRNFLGQRVAQAFPGAAAMSLRVLASAEDEIFRADRRRSGVQ